MPLMNRIMQWINRKCKRKVENAPNLLGNPYGGIRRLTPSRQKKPPEGISNFGFQLLEYRWEKGFNNRNCFGKDEAQNIVRLQNMGLGH